MHQSHFHSQTVAVTHLKFLFSRNSRTGGSIFLVLIGIVIENTPAFICAAPKPPFSIFGSKTNNYADLCTLACARTRQAACGTAAKPQA
jgi:hypothetical protein